MTRLQYLRRYCRRNFFWGMGNRPKALHRELRRTAEGWRGRVDEGRPISQPSSPPSGKGERCRT